MKHYFNEDKTKVLVELKTEDLENLEMYSIYAKLRYKEEGLETAVAKTDKY